MNGAPPRVLLLGANFCGNVGDLFILNAITAFLDKHCRTTEDPGVTIDVIPYPLRYDRRIAMLHTQSRPQVQLIEPERVLRRQFDRWMRHLPSLEQLCAKLYFSFAGDLLSRQTQREQAPVNGIIVAGGEMDVPYSMLDIHYYLRKHSKHLPVCYGPISIPEKPQYIDFLKSRFAEIEEVAIRDPISLQWLQGHAIENVRLVPDCAFLAYRTPEPKSCSGHIGLCLHSRWGYDRSLDKLVLMLADLLRKRNQKLLIFATNLHEDFRVINHMYELLKFNPCVEFSLPESAEKLGELVNGLDLTISDRLHALIVSMLHGTPVLPLATRQKIQGYCEYWQFQQTLSGNESAGELVEKMSIAKSPTQRDKCQKFCEQAHHEVSDYYLINLKKMGLLGTRNSTYH